MANIVKLSGKVSAPLEFFQDNDNKPVFSFRMVDVDSINTPLEVVIKNKDLLIMNRSKLVPNAVVNIRGKLASSFTNGVKVVLGSDSGMTVGVGV